MSISFSFGNLGGPSSSNQRSRSSPASGFPPNTATCPYVPTTGPSAAIIAQASTNPLYFQQARAGLQLQQTSTGPLFSVKQEKRYTETSCQTDDSLSGTKFVQGLKRLLQSGKFSDITLDVIGKEFRAHKNILAANSPVFAAMFEHDTKEQDTNTVDINDIDPDVFADFLKFMYSGSTHHLNSENVINLYIVADKYQVTELMKECSLYMIKHISLETFCDVMSLSLQYEDKELLETATNYFLKNSIYITKTAKWLAFMKENVEAANDLFTQVLELNKDFYSKRS